jgi:hypothetical protein
LDTGIGTHLLWRNINMAVVGNRWAMMLFGVVWSSYDLATYRSNETCLTSILICLHRGSWYLADLSWPANR